MLFSINKSYNGLHVNASEYSSDGRFNVMFATTTETDDVPSFDFVNLCMYDEGYKESVTLSFGKEALDKLVPMLKKLVEWHDEKNSSLLKIEG